jgi:hypothetical protein
MTVGRQAPAWLANFASLHLVCQFQRVVNLDPEVTHGAFRLAVTE